MIADKMINASHSLTTRNTKSMTHAIPGHPLPMLRKHLRVLSLAVVLAMGGGLTAALTAQLADAAKKKAPAALRHHSDVNHSEVDGMTALHWAAYHDDLSTAKLLVKAGASVEAKNRYGVTPLSLACVNGNGGMVAFFLEAGANSNTGLDQGEPVLMTAARTGKTGPVKALIAHGADVDARGRKDQTALMWAAAEGHVAVVNLLLEAGADFRTPLKSGFTPLFFAVREGKADVVHALLKAGIDLNEPVDGKKNGGLKRGMAPFFLAVENGHFELAAGLLDAGADPNDQRTGYTALHALTWVRKPDSGDSANGNPAPIGSGNLSSLQFARKLVEHGAKIDTQLKEGSSRTKGATAFFMAAVTADAPYMRLLLELGADPLLLNAENSTPLMVAAGLGRTLEEASAGTETEIMEVAQLLLDLGVDVNAVNNNGETAMHGAAYKSLPKVVQFLDENNATIEVWNRKNKKGRTPYLIAAGYRPGNFKPSFETMAAIEQVMLAHGVKPTEKPPARVDPYSNKTRKKQTASKEEPVKPVKLP